MAHGECSLLDDKLDEALELSRDSDMAAVEGPGQCSMHVASSLVPQQVSILDPFVLSCHQVN
jgi:hypothetical protein